MPVMSLSGLEPEFADARDPVAEVCRRVAQASRRELSYSAARETNSANETIPLAGTEA